MTPRTDTIQLDSDSHSTLLTYKSMLSALSDGELDNRDLEDLLEYLSKGTQGAHELHRFWKNIQLSKQILKHESLTLVSQDLHESIHTQISANLSGEKVLAFQQPKARSQKHFSFTQNLALAASVMFAVVFVWLGSQTPIRENVLALFENNEFASDSFANENRDVKYNTGMMQSEIPAFSQSFAQTMQQRELSHQVVAGDVGQPYQATTTATKSKRPIYLSKSRMDNYMRLHAGNASLNNNQGIIPFARLNAGQQPRDF